MPVIERTCTEAGMAALACDIVAVLQRTPNFCVWLIGEMGAGKTTLVRAILHTLGLPESEPVLSPTYTLMNEYEIGGQWYAHLDLYRAHKNLNLMDLGALDAKPFRGLFIEWAEAVDSTAGSLAPTHQLICKYGEAADTRHFLLK